MQIILLCRILLPFAARGTMLNERGRPHSAFYVSSLTLFSPLHELFLSFASWRWSPRSLSKRPWIFVFGSKCKRIIVIIDDLLSFLTLRHCFSSTAKDRPLTVGGVDLKIWWACSWRWNRRKGGVETKYWFWIFGITEWRTVTRHWDRQGLGPSLDQGAWWSYFKKPETSCWSPNWVSKC